MIRIGAPVAVVVFSHAALGMGQAGTLDPTFGTGGIVLADHGGGSDAVQGIAVRPDGKIAVVGTAFIGLQGDVVVACYNEDGTPDAAFGASGSVIMSPNAGNEHGEALCVQPDGRIVVTGYADFRMFIARYLADGTPDASFSSDGTEIITNWMQSRGYSVTVRSDGRILVGGLVSDGTNRQLALWRFGADGVPDASFGGDGEVTMDLPGNYAVIYGLASQSDGKIVGVGSTGASDWDQTMCVVRLEDDGTPDGTFDGDGILTFTDGTSYELLYKAIVQPDGQIIAAGYSRVGSADNFTLIRLGNDGSFDPSFDGDGIAHTLVGSSSGAFGIALQPDGKILAAGFANASAAGGIVRYSPAGSPDATFDSDGQVTLDLPGSPEGLNCMALDASGRILVGGYGQGSYNDFLLARYQNDLDIGIAETGNDGIRCHPNPASDHVFLELPMSATGPLTIRILNNSAQLVRTLRIPIGAMGTAVIDVSDLRNGLYMIECTVADRLLRARLVQQ